MIWNLSNDANACRPAWPHFAPCTPSLAAIRNSLDGRSAGRSGGGDVCVADRFRVCDVPHDAARSRMAAVDSDARHECLVCLADAAFLSGRRRQRYSAGHRLPGRRGGAACQACAQAPVLEDPCRQDRRVLSGYSRRFHHRARRADGAGWRGADVPDAALLSASQRLAGAAAGLSAAFNTPLAGIVFAIEELSRNFEQRASGIVITTIIFAGVVALGLNGNYTYFDTINAGDDSARELIVAVVVSGVLMGVAGGVFCWLLLNTHKWIPAPLRTLRAERPVVFGALCGLVVAIVGICAGGMTFGSGYAEAKGLLTDQTQLSAWYPLAKMVSMVGSYLPGIPGGIFAPSLSIGAGFGNLLHMVFDHTSLSMLIALAMVGYLAAVTQSPITAFVIVMEMINGHALVISLMATALLASRVSRFFAPPLYEALSERYAQPHR